MNLNNPPNTTESPVVIQYLKYISIFIYIFGITDFDNDLNGTTATVFCADETSGAAVFAKETKANPALVEKIVPKCAYVENKYLDKAGVKELSAIPSKEILIAKMLGCLQSSLSKFVYVLDSIAKAKESN